jgi:2-hydroxychromene-2-carboxylate isomerase
MTKFIDFYFDFISPYSYLAHKRIIHLNKRDKFNYKPILLGGLHNLGGITAPAFNERKMKNMKNDCSLIAQKNNIQFRWNEKFPLNSLNLMRGYLFIDEQIKNKFFDICFDSYWKDNVDITQDDNVKKILSDCNIDEKKYLSGIKEIKIKEKLKDLTSLAFENDVFGAPTFVVNDKLFWGQDRLEYALDEYNS